VFHRFHRELGTGVEGSGLGLSIVHDIAVAHAARVQLDESPALGGLRVRVQLVGHPIS
ncbi:ATP-binding protein, partial [Xanthomonas oryzae pv. oryzicola]